MRLSYLDFSRAVLFGLGIILHACWVYQDQSPVLAGTHDFIHSFRMPAFFLLSGLFSGLMLDRYGAEKFLFRRFRRLAVPLLFFGIVIDQLVNCGDIHTWSDWRALLNRSYWIDANWLQHLWFLSV